MFLYVHTTWWTRRMIHSWSPNIVFFYPFVDYDAFSSIARDPKSETVPHRVRQQRQHRERSSLRHGLAGPQSVSCAPSLGCSAEDELYAQSKALTMKCLSNLRKQTGTRVSLAGAPFFLASIWNIGETRANSHQRTTTTYVHPAKFQP